MATAQTRQQFLDSFKASMAQVLNEAYPSQADELTPFDKELIAKADKLGRFEYHKIDAMIDLADTPAAIMRLGEIRHDLLEHVRETI